MPSKWGTKISSRGIEFFCCFCRLHLDSRIGNFWLASLQHKVQQMYKQHKYSLFPLVSGCFVWTVLGCFCSIWSSYCKKITSRNDCGNHCDEIDSVPVHYISKRKREGAQKRLTYSYSNQVLVSVKFMLMLSASFFYISFLQITWNQNHLHPDQDFAINSTCDRLVSTSWELALQYGSGVARGSLADLAFGGHTISTNSSIHTDKKEHWTGWMHAQCLETVSLFIFDLPSDLSLGNRPDTHTHTSHCYNLSAVPFESTFQNLSTVSLQCYQALAWNSIPNFTVSIIWTGNNSLAVWGEGNVVHCSAVSFKHSWL